MKSVFLLKRPPSEMTGGVLRIGGYRKPVAVVFILLVVAAISSLLNIVLAGAVLFAAVMFWVIGRFCPSIGQELRLALALVWGHTVWIAYGGFEAPELRSLILFEAALCVVLTAWCLARMSQVSVALLALYVAVALVMNTALFMQQETFNAGAGDLLGNALMRLVVIVTLAHAVRNGLFVSPAKS
ncbi:hypothetical protein [Altericroceibacterium endophyticum]|uniref:Uncharacterized protein n=1 Tax=Altericroceibacterium endophyticum TaxID=1808508 RepID=A0A6I4T1A1_9SPHN|nr:hypothetical protein [Altericroceibacterium endophyticum]MXO64658.1 hypothetical protein [Altericroceibacterium endophyticum]